MNLQTLFATPVGITKHLELVDGVKPLFEQKELFGLAKEGSVGPFWTSLKQYNGKKPTLPPDSPAVDLLKATIIEGASTFIQSLGYAAEKYDFEVANLWMNRMKSGSTHTPHSHYGHIVSGCFYVEVPKNADTVCFFGPLGAINRADLDVTDYTIFNSGKWDLSVTAGDMVFWESYLRHEVPATEFEGLRLTMAFDVNATYKE